jgi:hypothetical protein
MARDVRRVCVVAELEDRQHHRLLEFAQYALAPHEMIWEEGASMCRQVLVSASKRITETP